jgi:hypothetical protein
VTLTGTGIGPILTVSATALDFGNVLLGLCVSRSLSVTNTGGGTLTGQVIANVAGISIAAGSILSLEANQSQTITLDFCPLLAGVLNGSISIPTNGGVLAVTLNGHGL